MGYGSKLVRLEKGAIQFVILFGLMGIMLLVPILLDFARVYYSRAVASTAADAGVLAAAQEYARRLSGAREGYCNQSRAGLLRNYLSEVEQTASNRAVGMQYASNYARDNRAVLDSAAYRSWVSTGGMVVDNMQEIPTIQVRAATAKDIAPLMESLYRRSFQVKGAAEAKASLRSGYYQAERRCIIGYECVQWTWTSYWGQICVRWEPIYADYPRYVFEWQVTLVK